LSSQSISRRYAVALADVLVEIGQQRTIQNELISWEQMISSNSQLREVFANPTIPYEQKRAVLNELIKRTGIQQTTANFLQILLKNQRLTALAEINSKLADVVDERAGAVAARVTTANPVNEETKRILSEKLSRFTGKAVRLSFAVDDSLIGGIVTRVGSTVYDGSIRTQLDEMEKALAGQA
jgi:F-type H+-transporting ATPase subunit delta